MNLFKGRLRGVIESFSAAGTFYIMVLCVVIWALLVFVYDIFQAQIERETLQPRVFYHPVSDWFTFEKHAGTVEIVYASMFGPGEPVMRVRDHWIDRFEEEYGKRLSDEATRALTGEEKELVVTEVLRMVDRIAPRARRLLDDAEAETDGEKKDRMLADLDAWLVSEGFEYVRAGKDGGGVQDRWRKEFIAALETFAVGQSTSVDIRARVNVKVERRWQGRWVLSANRPRFLTGREVPDVIVGSKMELLALVQDDYAVALDDPLPGEALSPLDSPDTWAGVKRTWRDAFLPAMLEEGKYTFIDDLVRKDKVYLSPTWCNTVCMFYNKVLFKKAGVENVPRTWPEFIRVCEKLKTAGIAPLTADQAVYADMWMTWLVFRVVGPEDWESTICGVPADKPPQERRSEPKWTDERYVRVFSEIRRLRDNGYFKKGFRGLTWPASQRGFASGDAAMMICGSWLPQELGGYKDIEMQGNFELGCFSFPEWPGGREIDQKAAQASVYGLMVCRQGRATKHAVELVKYLSARDHPEMVHNNAQISCMTDGDFPPGLAGIADNFRNAAAIYNRMPTIYARRFNSSILMPLYTNFFLQEKGEKGYVTVEEFLERLQEETDKYLTGGGEAGFE